MSRLSHRGEARDAIEFHVSVPDPISRNYPTRKGEVGVGFHTDPIGP